MKRLAGLATIVALATVIASIAYALGSRSTQAGGLPTATTAPPPVLGSPLAGLKPASTFPPAGTDAFESLAQVDVQLGCAGQFRPVFLAGDTVVRRSTPQLNGSTGQMSFQTEMLSLNLTGFDPLLGGVTVTLNPTQRSLGHVTENLPTTTGSDFPADSFFDVFVNVTTSGGIFFPLQLHNTQPVRMQNSSILSLPPIGSEYRSTTTAVPLVNGSGTTIACIKHASHTPEDPSHVLLEKQLIAIQQKVARLCGC